MYLNFYKYSKKKQFKRRGVKKHLNKIFKLHQILDLNYKMVSIKKDNNKSNKIKESGKTRSFVIGTGNIISQLFFFWVFFLIFVLRRTKDLKDLILVLRDKDTATFNDELLEKKWKEEKKLAEKQNR